MGTRIKDTATLVLQEHGKKIKKVKKLFKTVRKHLKINVLSLEQKEEICRLFDTYNGKSVVMSKVSQVPGSSRSFSKRTTLSSTDISLSLVTLGSSTSTTPDGTVCSLHPRKHSKTSLEKSREWAKDDMKQTPPKGKLEIQRKLSKSEDLSVNPNWGSRKSSDRSHKLPGANDPQSKHSNTNYSQKRKLHDQASNKKLVQAKRTRYENQDNHASGRRHCLRSNRQEQPKQISGISSPRLIDPTSGSYSNHREGVQLPSNPRRGTTRHIGKYDLSIKNNPLKIVYKKDDQQLVKTKLGTLHTGKDPNDDIDLRAKREILR